MHSTGWLKTSFMTACATWIYLIKKLIFITGTAGIGKSELAKAYAKKNDRKYTNIIYLFYDGNLKKCIAHMEFSDDNADMNEDMLFDRHMKILKKLHSDSLVIIDNFNVLPKEDAFFKEFIKLNCKILVTSRCNISQYGTVKIAGLDADTELTELFYKHCSSSKASEEVVKEIIQTVDCHMLTVCLSALSLTASGMELEELLAELKTCGLNITSGEDVELYKDNDFTDGLMIEHLRKLLQLGKLSDSRLNILRNLSLLPISRVLKNSFKNWLKLDNLADVNNLIKYGFINEYSDNKKINLHPLLQEVIAIETIPTVTACRTMIDRDKYLVSDYLPKLTDRISYIMEEYKLDSPCDKALLLDYKAECFLLKKIMAMQLRNEKSNQYHGKAS